MYASPNPFRGNPSRPSAGMYAQVGVETGVTTADPHKLVALLFDGLIDSIAQARGALKDGRVEVKCAAISRAVRIVDEGLRGGLNMNSSSLSADLASLYGYLIARLTYANLKNDDAALQECTRLVLPLRDAWTQIRGKVVNGVIV
jgi:flagellar secretion chaperone FliS